MTLAELTAAYPEQAEPVVDGLVRRGETMNIIAAPKVGKTWLAHGLARSVSRGDDWLGFSTQRGRVLVCDGELHPSELNKRLASVVGTHAMTAEVDVLALRGQGVDLIGLARLLDRVKPQQYALIVIDALYRFIPVGISENDNAQMMSLYNRLDQIASHTQAAIVVVHHSSKGDQSSKSITDFGAGAGAIARAADTHAAIRPHQVEGMAVFQAVTRSFSKPDDRSIRWEYPHWEQAPWAPQLATRKTAADEKQRRLDEEADREIRKALDGRRRSISQLRTETGMGQQRVERALKRLKANGRTGKSRLTGKRTERFSLPSSP